jgi:hypothetical protein
LFIAVCGIPGITVTNYVAIYYSYLKLTAQYLSSNVQVTYLRNDLGDSHAYKLLIEASQLNDGEVEVGDCAAMSTTGNRIIII